MKISFGISVAAADIPVFIRIVRIAIFPIVKPDGSQVIILSMNIPGLGNRESGKMETGIPAGWKPLFR